MTNRLVAVLDVNSSGVGAALLAEPRRRPARTDGRTGQCATIIAAGREALTVHPQLEPERFLKEAGAALARALESLLAARLGAPRQVWCFLAAPFCASQTRIIKVEREEAVSVTPAIVAEIVQKEAARFKTENHNWFTGAADGRNHRLFESRILRIKLNGYQSADPYRQRARQLEVVNYFSLAGEKVLSQFNAAATGALHHNQIKFHSFLLAFYQVWQALVGADHSYLICHVSGELTEIALVWRGILWQSVSYPTGINSLLRQLSHRLATSPAEAASALKIYFKDQHHEPVKRLINQILSDLKGAWLKTFKDGLHRVVEGAMLAEEILLVGEEPWLPLLREWLISERFDYGPRGTGSLKPVIVERDLFKNFCPLDSRANPDLPLLIEAIFCDRILNT